MVTNRSNCLLMGEAVFADLGLEVQVLEVHEEVWNVLNNSALENSNFVKREVVMKVVQNLMVCIISNGRFGTHFVEPKQN